MSDCESSPIMGILCFYVTAKSEFTHMPRIDLSDAPIIDHHAHALIKAQPQTVQQLQN